MTSFIMLFDRDHLKEGQVCINSILKQGKTKIYVLCLDNETYSELDGLFNCISLEELENCYPKLEEKKIERGWPAYTQMCKVHLPTFVMDKYKEKQLIYVDSDMLFYSHWEPIEKCLENASFVVASKEKDTVEGKYNGGFFATKDTTYSRTWFSFWRDKVIEWCSWEHHNGLFADEGYLNYLSDFKDIGVAPCTVNLAWWNIDLHEITEKNGVILIDGEPLICFHFQGSRPHVNEYLDKLIYQPYYEEVK